MDDMDPVDQVDRVIPKHGGYRNLKSYQVAQLVYDLTVWFCDRYIDRRSRTQNRWFKQLDPACKTSLREARLQGFPRRLK